MDGALITHVLERDGTVIDEAGIDIPTLRAHIVETEASGDIPVSSRAGWSIWRPMPTS